MYERGKFLNLAYHTAIHLHFSTSNVCYVDACVGVGLGMSEKESYAPCSLPPHPLLQTSVDEMIPCQSCYPSSEAIGV